LIKLFELLFDKETNPNINNADWENNL